MVREAGAEEAAGWAAVPETASVDLAAPIGLRTALMTDSQETGNRIP